MRTIRHEIDTQDDIRILPLADLHISDPQCDKKLVREIIDKVLADPNMYVIIDGDVLNASLAGSRSDVYGATMTPQAEMDLAVELLKPLADAGKILAFVQGNHEIRYGRSVGLDAGQIIAARLGIGHLYSPTSVLLFLRFGSGKKVEIDRHGRAKRRRQTYTIYVRHGNGGGKRAGSKVNVLEDMAKTITANVYVCAHTHQPASFRQSHFVCNPTNQTVTQQEQLFVNCAAFLDWSGSYGDALGFAPNSKRMPVITLSASEHDARCEI